MLIKSEFLPLITDSIFKYSYESLLFSLQMIGILVYRVLFKNNIHLLLAIPGGSVHFSKLWCRGLIPFSHILEEPF